MMNEKHLSVVRSGFFLTSGKSVIVIVGDRIQVQLCFCFCFYFIFKFYIIVLVLIFGKFNFERKTF